MSQKIRTRYAPSPTGRMHVGNLRTALYAYLIAKHEQGDFLLRIEDTDQERFVEGATEIIYRTMQEAGLAHDEGPDIGGPVGPYVQSERVQAGLYMQYAKELIDKGEAYYCFCTPERLAGLKQTVGEGEEAHEISIYDKHCLSLSREEVEANLAAGKPYVIRQNNPAEGTTTFHDVLYGNITVDNAELDDMILIKSDGYPTYNFANVVDDHLMGITHVVRGNEYISSSPKYNRLYDAFGWEVPQYVHCPLITNMEHKKLSKRDGDTSFEDLATHGYLPETIVNFVALLGWSPEDNEEIKSLEELTAAFDYHKISKSPAAFDYEKLKWMNGEYYKKMDPAQFYARIARPVLEASIHRKLDLVQISAMVQTRVSLPEEIPALVDFFDAVPDYETALYANKKMKTDAASSLTVLKELRPILAQLPESSYDNDTLYATLQRYITEKEVKNGYVLWPIRIAVSGKAMTPCGATEIMALLGREETLTRVDAAISKLEE
ncbi:MAG: glutamate--tRNA ligase [Butyrivibrio sp.]|nr:glutamate--tRNA ligase [Butyrivibrio sp.]